MTISKKGHRSGSLIERSEQAGSSSYVSSWMSELAKTLDKNAVQPYRKEEQSLYDQISSVMNGAKSKFHSVDEAVQSMQERSGLLAYHSKIEAQKDDGVAKLAQQITSAGKEDEIALFKLHPSIKNTLMNILEDTNGNLSLPSIIERLKSIHKNDVPDESLFDDESLLRFINEKSIAIRKEHPEMPDNLNLGKREHFDEKDVDPSNSDALFSLTPAVIGK